MPLSSEIVADNYGDYLLVRGYEIQVLYDLGGGVVMPSQININEYGGSINLGDPSLSSGQLTFIHGDEVGINSNYFTLDASTGGITQYNGEYSFGVPSDIALDFPGGNTAPIVLKTLISGALQGWYRVNWFAEITQAASLSSVLGGTTGFQVQYTSYEDNIVKTIVAPVINSSANTTTTVISGSVNLYCADMTDIKYSFGYTSVGGTPMTYQLSVTAEKVYN